jgi:hypothetical protein
MTIADYERKERQKITGRNDDWYSGTLIYIRSGWEIRLKGSCLRLQDNFSWIFSTGFSKGRAMEECKRVSLREQDNAG